MAADPKSAGDGSTVPTPDPQKPGFLTSEFWATVVTLLLPAATLVFHQDFSGEVQAIAAAAAGIATAVYTISRALAKSAQTKATVALAAASMTAPVQAGGSPAATISPEVQAAAAELAKQIRGGNGGSPNGKPAVNVIAVSV